MAFDPAAKLYIQDVTLRDGMHAGRLVDPVQPGGGQGRLEIEPDGVGFLLAALQLEEVAELGGEEPQPQPPAVGLDGLGELLPELGDGGRQRGGAGLDGDDGAGPQAEGLLPPPPARGSRGRRRGPGRSG